MRQVLDRRAQLLIWITLLGASLRLFRLGAQSLWLDEVFSLFVSQQDLASIIKDTAQDTMPPLYYLLLRCMMIFGSSEFNVRLLSALWGIATIPLLYVMAKRLFDPTVSLFSAFLLAVNPFHIFYAQEARMYTQLGCLSLLAVYFFIKAWQGNKKQDWLFFTLTITLSLYTHNLAFLTVLALGIFVWLRWQKARSLLMPLILSHLGVGLLFSPWFLVLPKQIQRVHRGFWVSSSSPLSVLTTPYVFIFGYAVPATLAPLTLFVGLLIVFLTLDWASRAMKDAKEERERLLLLLILLGGPLLTSFLLSLFRPMFPERTLIAASFPLYILLAWGWRRAPKTLAKLITVALVLLLAIALANLYFNPSFAKPSMREATRYLAANFQPGDAVIHTSDSSYLAFAYYAPSLDRHFLYGDPDYQKETTRAQSGYIVGIRPEFKAKVLAGKKRLWLVVALDHNVEYQIQKKQEFDAAHSLLGEQDVGGIKLYLYALE